MRGVFGARGTNFFLLSNFCGHPSLCIFFSAVICLLQDLANVEVCQNLLQKPQRWLPIYAASQLGQRREEWTDDCDGHVYPELHPEFIEEFEAIKQAKRILLARISRPISNDKSAYKSKGEEVEMDPFTSEGDNELEGESSAGGSDSDIEEDPLRTARRGC